MHTHHYKKAWTWLSDDKDEDGEHIALCNCGKRLGWKEIERRLNAVEMLTANDAMKACQFIPQHEIPETGLWNAESRLVDALSEYARILEEERDMSIILRNAAFIELSGAGRLFIEEQPGGGYHIQLKDQMLEEIWLGISQGRDVHFMYWRDAMKILQQTLTTVP